MSPQTTQLVIRRFGPRSNRFSRRFERRRGMRQSTVEVFMSPIRAKFADLRKLGKPLWGAAFIKQEAIIHPHDLEKSHKAYGADGHKYPDPDRHAHAHSHRNTKSGS